MIVERIKKLDISNRPVFTGLYGYSYGQEYFVEDNLCKYSFRQELYRYLRSEGYTTIFYNAEFNFFSYEESQLETFFFKKPEDISKDAVSSRATSHRFVAPIASPNGRNRRMGIRLTPGRTPSQAEEERVSPSVDSHETNQLISHRPNAILVKAIPGDQFFQLKRNEGVLSAFFNFVDKNPEHKLAIILTKPSEITFSSNQEQTWRTRLQTDYSQQRVSGLKHRLIVCYDVKDVKGLNDSFQREDGFFFSKWFFDQMFPYYNDSSPDLTKPSNALFQIEGWGRDEVANVLKRRRIMEGLNHTFSPIPFDDLCLRIKQQFKANILGSKEKKIETVMDMMDLTIETLETKIMALNRKEFSEDLLRESLSTIHGQQDNMNIIADKVVTWINRPDSAKKPLVFMFAGTSGTGKTYTAQKIGEALKDRDYGYIKLDMNEYSSEMDSQKLLGSAPGYVGSDRESPIFEAVRQNDKLVIVFDEIEKAHPTLFTNLMTLMDEGFLENGRGDKVDFRQSIIVFTTNLAMNVLIQQKAQMIKAGLSIDSYEFQEATKQTIKNNGIKNEICGRISCLLIYNTLDASTVARITIEETRKLGLMYGLEINNISQNILKEMASHVANSNEGARPIRAKVASRLEKKIQAFRKEFNSKNSTNAVVKVDIDDDLNVVISDSPFMSVERIMEQYPRLTAVSKTLPFDKDGMSVALKKVVGQEDNIKVIVDKIDIWIKKRKKDRPLVFMFAGTSGTGKTYTAKNIQKSISNHNYRFVRVNMNEYHSEADSWKFLGSSTGYSGSTDDSPIFAARKLSDKLVILFDEIEKAHPSLFTTIMGLMDEGMLSNGRGQQFDFKNSIIIFTTNLSMDRLKEAKAELLKAGVSATDRMFQDRAKGILEEAGLRTEICGRIDWLLIYNPFNTTQVAQITLDQIRELGKEYDININKVCADILMSIATKCAGHNEGARPIRSEVHNLIEPILQAAYENQDADFRADELYDINENLNLVTSSDHTYASIDEILPNDNMATSPESAQAVPKQKAAQSINEIFISSTPCFTSGYSYEEYRKAMGLLVLDGGNTGTASGFLISADGYIMTCEHCTQAKRITFIKDDSKEEYEAIVIYSNRNTDIAILKIDVENMPFLQITDSMKPLKVGADVVILGYPSGTDINHNVSAFEGKVSNRKDTPGVCTYQTDALATHGSSGGAFISKQDGIVYGLLAGGFEDAKINVATDIRNILRAKDFVLNFI